MGRRHRNRSTRPRESSGTRSDELLRYNLVAFIDLLGQSNLLRRLTALPETDEQRHKTIALLKETVGRVRGFRKCFREFFACAAQGAERFAELPAPLARQARAMRRSHVRVRGFSDSVIIDVSLAGADESCTAINGVYAALAAIGGTFAVFLGGGVPVRAGVDVGIGIDVTEGELYGPALERAHFLESRQAAWPRIAVGGELVRYVDQLARAPGTTIRANYAATLARSCRSLIAKDQDETFILDYLGQGMAACHMLPKPEVIQSCRQAVADQLRQHAGNDKLRSRWEKVHAYIEQRAPRIEHNVTGQPCAIGT